MNTITVVDDPPQPMGGEGEVLETVNGTQVVLTWEGGNLVDVKPVTAESGMGDVTLASEPPTCWKCLHAEDGHMVKCWIVAC